MIDKHWFVKKLEKFGCLLFSRTELLEFFDTIPQMIIFSYALKYTDPKTENVIYQEIFSLAEKQWKVLKELGNKELEIYRDTEDKESVAIFVDLIEKEKILREKIAREQLSALAEFRQIIDQRIELYKIAFDYTAKDRQEARRRGIEKAKEFMEKRRGKGKILLKLGVLGAAAGAAASAGYWHHKKNRNRKKKKK